MSQTSKTTLLWCGRGRIAPQYRLSDGVRQPHHFLLRQCRPPHGARAAFGGSARARRRRRVGARLAHLDAWAKGRHRRRRAAGGVRHGGGNRDHAGRGRRYVAMAAARAHLAEHRGGRRHRRRPGGRPAACRRRPGAAADHDGRGGVPRAAGRRAAAARHAARRGARPLHGPQPHHRADHHVRRGARPEEPVLPVVGRHQRQGDHPGRFLHDQRELRPLPQGDLRRVALLDAPLLVVQQPVVPQVDRVHAGHRRHPAVEVVRRLPRPCGVLQRPLRPSDPRADRHAGSAGRARLHVVPFDYACRQHDGPGGLRDRISAAARARGQREPGAEIPARPADLHRSRAAPRSLPQAVPSRPDAGVLLELPQSTSRRAGQPLPLVPRLQRLRQLAGLGGIGRRGALVLLPEDAA